MKTHPSLASLLESFFRTRLARQKNASPATIASYRDALHMLILFAAARIGRNRVHLPSRTSIGMSSLRSLTIWSKSGRTQ